MAAAGIDLVPLVEGGGGRLEHDVELLFEAQATEPWRRVEAAGSGQYLPGDGEGRPLVLQLPHVVGEPRSGLVAVAEVALVPGDPVPS